MSRNLKIFLSTIFWVPFSFLLWLVFKGYAQSHLIHKIEMCAQTENSIPNMNSEQADIAKFVTCLKDKTNPLVWWHLEPERLYQMAKPHTPCQWVGRWQAKRNNMSFAIDLDAYGKYQIDLESLQNYQNQDQDENSFKGIWSSPSLTKILWFNNARIWPVDENTVEWLNPDQLVINELDGSKTYYQRQSPRVPDCPSYP